MTKVINEKSAVLSGAKEFQTLIETLDAKREVVLSVEGEEFHARERKWNTWKLLAITHAQLFTDETYQFHKAAKVVNGRFEETVSSKVDQDEEERTQQLHFEMMTLRYRYRIETHRSRRQGHRSVQPPTFQQRELTSTVAV
ncbi:hypothetical protein DVH05_005295 [Phytophthora capsici]|nr:hypothetical protein DVH05_005295 [Phytophthora capsici]